MSKRFSILIAIALIAIISLAVRPNTALAWSGTVAPHADCNGWWLTFTTSPSGGTWSVKTGDQFTGNWTPTKTHASGVARVSWPGEHKDYSWSVDKPEGCTPVPGEHNVPACHRTASDSNPYVQNSPDYNSIVGASGHDNHNGPIWFPGITGKWGDIIPSFWWHTPDKNMVLSNDSGTPPGPSGWSFYGGKNWPAGQSILANGCVVTPPPPVEHKVELNVTTNCDGFSFQLFVDGQSSGAVTGTWNNPYVLESAPTGIGVSENPGEVYHYFLNGAPVDKSVINGYVIHEPEQCMAEVHVAIEQFNNCDQGERKMYLAGKNGESLSSHVLVDSWTWPKYGAQPVPAKDYSALITDGPPGTSGTYKASFPAMGVPECGKPPVGAVVTKVTCEKAVRYVVINGEQELLIDSHDWLQGETEVKFPAKLVDLGDGITKLKVPAVTLKFPEQCKEPVQPGQSWCTAETGPLPQGASYTRNGGAPGQNIYTGDQNNLIFGQVGAGDQLQPKDTVTVFTTPPQNFTAIPVDPSRGYFRCVPIPVPVVPICTDGSSPFTLVRRSPGLYGRFGCKDPVLTVIIDGKSETLTIDPTGKTPGSQPRYSNPNVPCSAKVHVEVLWPNGAVSKYDPVCGKQ